MNFKFHFLVIILFFSCLCSSCRLKKPTTYTPIEHKSSVKRVLAQLDSNTIKPEWYSGKLAFQLRKENGKGIKSFKASIRLKKDSAIWLSITPLMGIELARVLILKDSVFMLNRLKSTYFAGGFDFLSEKFNTEIDYHFIQSFLFIEPLHKYTDSTKVWHKYDGKSHTYILSSVKQSVMNKTFETDKKNKIIQKFGNYWHQMNIDGMYQLKSQILHDVVSNNKLEVTYTEYKNIESGGIKVDYPNIIEAIMHGSDTLNVKISVNSLSFNKKKKISFRIPDKYEEIKL